MSTAAAPAKMAALNLARWIAENEQFLRPPVSNKQLYTGADDVILFVSGGPNTRNDFHVNPTEELFYQLRGDIALRVRPLDDSKSPSTKFMSEPNALP
jgi:3-hydroxyanthranilate 3,4-dioxygenase